MRGSAIARWERFFWPVVATALLILIWHLAVEWSATKVLPSPLAVAKAIRELSEKSLLWRDVLDSLGRVAAGFGAAVLLGVPLGLLLGTQPFLNRTVNPVLQLLRPISPIAWIPVAIVLLGIGSRAAVFLIFLGAFFPIAFTSAASVAEVPLVFRQVGRNFGLSPFAQLTQIIFPAAVPRILIGLRIALGIAWLVVVAAEMIAVDSGLGYLVIDSRNAGKRYDLVVAAMILIGVIGLALDTLIRRLEKLRSVRWGFGHAG